MRIKVEYEIDLPSETDPSWDDVEDWIAINIKENGKMEADNPLKEVPHEVVSEVIWEEVY